MDPRQPVVVQRQRPQGRNPLERAGLDPADVVVVQLEIENLIIICGQLCSDEFLD